MYINIDKRRIIYGGEIDEGFSANFIDKFLTLDDHEGKIELICTGSVGGYFDAESLAVIDYIRNSANIIDFYGSGIQGSSQALMAIAADNVYLTSESAYFLYHNGTCEIQSIDLQNDKDAKFLEKTKQAVDKLNSWSYHYIASNSCRPPKYWQERIEKEAEVIIFAEEALELELIDAIKHY